MIQGPQGEQIPEILGGVPRRASGDGVRCMTTGGIPDEFILGGVPDSIIRRVQALADSHASGDVAWIWDHRSCFPELDED